MRRFLLFFLFLAAIFTGFSQTTFHQSYNILGSDDYGNGVVGSPSGSFVVGSTSKAGAGSYDAMLMRLDSAGGVVWQSQLGGTGFDVGRALTPFQGAGFVVTGQTTSLSATNDIAISLIDSSGVYQGSAKYGFDSIDEIPWDITAIGDSNLLIIGTTTANNSGGKSNMFVIRTDKDASPLWMKTYGTLFGNSSGQKIFYFDGIGIIAIGSTSSGGPGGDDMYLIHIDPATGNIQDQILYGAAGHDEGWFFTIDGAHLIIGGLTGSTSGPNRSNIFITALDPNNLTKVWSKTYGGDTSSELRFLNVDPTDGNVIAGGDKNFPGTGSDGIVFKVDTATGNVIWATTFGTTGDDYMEGGMIASDGSAFGVGETNETSGGPSNNVFAVRVASDGSLCDGSAFGLTVRDLADSIIANNSPDHRDSAVAFPFAGGPLFTSNNYAATANDYCFGTGVRTLTAKDNTIRVYPNPTSGKLFIESASIWNTKVKMSVYNMLGAEVMTKNIAPGTKDFTIDLSNSPKGMYIISFNDGTTITTEKVTIN